VSDFLVIVEHGDTPQSRRLRRLRLRIALVIAAVEGILVLAGEIPWWVVMLAAAAALLARIALRSTDIQVVRQLTWIAAVSQLTVVLVPVAAAVLTALAVVVLVVIAIVALAALLRDRG
jgi:hypothetical protein